MTPLDPRSDTVVIHLLDDTPAAHPEVTRCWLPLAVWDGVCVRVNVRQGLTVMERFAIEALLALRDCDEADLEAIAGLPRELGSWVLTSLEHKGLAFRHPDLKYGPNTDECTKALASGSVVTQREEHRTVLCFPETEEFVVLAEGRTVTGRLREINPMGQFPLTDQFVNHPRSDILTRSLAEGRVYGEVIDGFSPTSDPQGPIDSSCPAYQVSFALARCESPTWQLTFRGTSRRRRSRKHHDEPDQSGTAMDFHQQVIGLPALPLLARKWRDHLQQALNPADFRTKVPGMGSVAFQDGTVTAAINGESAGQLGKRHLLCERMGLSITVDRSLEYELPLALRPADDASRELFALDNAVRSIISASDRPQALAAVCGDDRQYRPIVMGRMWSLRLYEAVYDLRESEDFSL